MELKTFRLGEPFELALKQSAECVDGNLKLALEDIGLEEIAAGPEGYPAGSGITVSLVLREEDTSTRIVLELLSEGYKAKSEEKWEGYRITLIDANEKGAELKVVRE